MPLKFLSEADDAAVVDPSILLDENGKMNAHALIVEDFLESVDFDDLFDHPAVEDAVQMRECYARVDENGDTVECEAGAPGAFDSAIEFLDGTQVAEAIDFDDLYGMFVHHVTAIAEASDDDGVAGKLRVATIADLLDEDALDEGPFKKGDFKKLYHGKMKTSGGKGGVAPAGPKGKYKGGRGLVNKMTLAMFHKNAIERAPKGSGYRKGTWNRDGDGYGGGTASGHKEIAQYRVKNKSKAAKLAKLTGVGKKKVNMKAAVKAGANAAKVKAAAKGAGQFVKKAKKIEGVSNAAAGTPVNESYDQVLGAGLAGRVIAASNRAANPHAAAAAAAK